MSKVIILRGIQGSGKTTWALDWVNQNPDHRIRLNRDDIRLMFGRYWLDDKDAQRHREEVISDMINQALRSAMTNKLDIVIDNMNLSDYSVKDIRNTVTFMNHKLDSYGVKYDIEFKDFKTPLDVCIERDSHRDRPIGKEIITNTYNRYKDFYEGN